MLSLNTQMVKTLFLSISLIFLIIGTVNATEEFPFIHFVGTNARAMGMGGAHIAVANDVSALYYNPSALALVRKLEISVGLFHNQTESKTTGTIYAEKLNATTSNTKLNSIGFAYPFPVLRGSFVLGFSANRVYDFDYKMLRANYNPNDTNINTAGRKSQKVLESGGVYAYSIGVGGDVSKHLSLGIGMNFYHGKINSEWKDTIEDTKGNWNTYPKDFKKVDYIYRENSNYDGFNLSTGCLIKASDKARMGLVIATPLDLIVSGSVETGTDSLFDNDDRLYDTEKDFPDEDHLSIPFNFGAGISFIPIKGLLIATDAWYIDWNQIKYTYGDGTTDEKLSEKYDGIVRIHSGVEYQFPAVPVSIRGGLYYEPIAYKPDLVKSQKVFTTVGVGGLIDKVLALDLAWVQGGWEQSEDSYDVTWLPEGSTNWKTPYTYTEKRSQSKILFSAAYRW